ncbi:AhlS family quorum-quenching N-acyl homoserine lactonase [Staphylococcus saprophyticus]|uniref:Similar to quorum-quenching N-acyl homoserine lactonase n=1 Tax=Staphylococcus saprophyticus subsp. saprophyticus (strain ATCC 15305 / DSM 20229 / NCIMB 8711 / NCTC 7292 / S-41) TaxID=342451 RepID=Q4A0L9_STAS1|nr:N-acyl homoserine lactonase family protein [Staphylococcus saprophyticus]CRV26451.1 beta-lactamase domain-containing protein [Streptococcus equi subsp. equi]ASE58406.1 MBL fold metallo-hydrolase [Staphylococcus saprophyticus]ASF19371.1 MBL fold metallo-hydrolase [Staphylococcus saprophyticus]MCM3120646.1 N-acyl homoserine lactonase family protein [Staphylococcus saprophyticus]MDW3880383.1 N-acyl homoserine lactonase family protein [Staphylococcus saprophyticus]
MVNVKKERMKVYVLDNGRMKMDKNLMIANSNQATLDDPKANNEMHEFPIYTVFIDHPDAKILFDTACNPNAMGDSGRWISATQKAFPYFADEACHLPNRLEQINVDPKEVDFVIASHLHLDHAGCLEYFTNATIIVHDDELSGAMKTYARNQQEGAYIWADIDAWVKNNLKWRTIKKEEDNLKLVDGVRILNYGSGHAWGIIGLEIESAELGTIILASDAIYTKESIEDTLKPPGILYDSIGWTKSVEKIQRLAKEKNAQIWFGHDGEQFEGFRKSTEGYYE